ncbi:hypothetical protein D3C87_1263070 [compost metagenome]
MFAISRREGDSDFGSEQNLDITRDLPRSLRCYFPETRELVESTSRSKKGILKIMKSLLSLLVILSASFAQAKPDCSYNEYGLTRKSMVVAFDRSVNRFADVTAQLDEGEFFFNELKDPSCAAIEVHNNNEVK